jgi:hypothetical protein
MYTEEDLNNAVKQAIFNQSSVDNFRHKEAAMVVLMLSENDNIFIYRPNIPPIKAINKTMAGNDI